jgi:hypothetical protein
MKDRPTQDHVRLRRITVDVRVTRDQTKAFCKAVKDLAEEMFGPEVPIEIQHNYLPSPQPFFKRAS